MRPSDLQQALLDRLQALTAAPFLFVGSGMSRRYLGLPSWDGLLAHFANEGLRPYDYYRSSADGDLPQAASAMAADFHQLWWSEEFESRRAGAPVPAGQQSALKIEISRYLEKGSRLDDPAVPAVTDLALGEELDLLRTAVIDGVITTNYDTMLAQVFDTFRTYIGQDQLLFGDAQGIAEIYHIHGSVTEPETLVLTSEDYRRFEDRNAYLAAKLMTIFVEHPVVFLGYSLSDPNITSILREIAHCLTTTNISHLANRLIVVEWHGDLAEPEMSASNIVVDGTPIPITLLKVSDYLPVFGALAQLRRPLPALLLRALRDQVYQYVLNPPDTPGELCVVDIDSAEAEGQKIVFGIGRFDKKAVTALGYRALRREDIADHVLGLSDLPLSAEDVLSGALPEILKARPQPFTPVWKYLREAGRVDSVGNVDLSGLEPSVVEAAQRKVRNLYPNPQYQKRFAAMNPRPTTPGDLNVVGLAELVLCAPLLPREGYKPKQLLDVLLERKPECGRGSTYATAFYKTVCLYDMLEYGLENL